MNEIEVKVLNVNCEEIKTKIKSLGGVLVKNEFQENHIFSLPEDIKTGGYIRIRVIEDSLTNSKKIFLCGKKLISQSKFRKMDESEFEVNSFKEAFNFLNMINIKFLHKENKKRESYKLNNTLIEFDTWDKSIFPDTYIEIEAENEKDLLSTLSLLNINKENVTSKGLLEIKKDMGLI